MIVFSDKTKLISLHTKNTSYIMCIFRGKYLLHLHWGKRIELLEHNQYVPLDERVNLIYSDPGDKSYFVEDLPFEYGFWGKGDFRAPSAQIIDSVGSVLSDFVYKSHIIVKGKPAIPGLPSTFSMEDDETETLEVNLINSAASITVHLMYTVFPYFDVITRHVRVENNGGSSVKIEKLMSASVDFIPHEYELLTLPGSWGRERWIERQPLRSGMTSIGSSRGISSHQFNPFIALLEPGTTENYGEVYGYNLVYSGNFVAEAERNQDNRVRAQLGINPFTFSWNLYPEESFSSPEVILVFSDSGLNGLSSIYHEFYRERLSVSLFSKTERPVLVNNWEATYFSFNEQVLLPLAEHWRDLGIELFVLDDGWFERRDTDTSGLGDWVVNRKKFPGGIEGFSEKIRNMGMKFGLWFEPEMVSPDSELFKNHPDWALQYKNSVPSEGRNQLVLDLSRTEIVNYIINVLKNVLQTGAVDYVKWDMNRSLTDVYSSSLSPENQGELSHRYMLGLYRIMEEITSEFPHILFEGCAAGGGRFDPGILHYMPQYWTSDNTDAMSRLKIQYGTSLVYPPLFMGSHVSAAPNHQIGRYTGIETRGNAAMMGNLGYELNFAKLNEQDIEHIKGQVTFYKNHRTLIQFGRFYRLISPFEGNTVSWMIVNREKEEFILFYYQILAVVNVSRSCIRLTGLDEKKRYRQDGSKDLYTGSELMHRGYYLPVFNGDFQSAVVYFSAEGTSGKLN